MSVPPSPRVVAIVQARMGSTRLPSKSLAPLAGRPLAVCVADRVARAARVHEVAIATTTEPADDELMTTAAAYGLRATRGPVDDIAGRLQGAAAALDADYLVRVWGDCPLVDPAAIDDLVALCVDGGHAFAANGVLGHRTFPPGLDAEVYRRDALDEIVGGTTDARYREFPVEYVLAHRDRLPASFLQTFADFSDLHLTVDYPEDLEAVRRIYEALGDRRSVAGLRELLELFAERPELPAAFAHKPRNVEYKAFLHQIGR
jgi:spore coat polysaccharide biosynthesis protein SpsF